MPSQAVFEIRVASGSEPNEIETASGRLLQHPAGDVPADWHADQIWRRIVTGWERRQELLSTTGAALGSWLFSDTAADELRRTVQSLEDDAPPLRIELRIPSGDRSRVPWELTYLEGLGFLAVHERLSLVRTKDRGEQAIPPVRGQLRVHLVGIELEANRGFAALRTSEEIERLRQAVEGLGGGKYSVEVDFQGRWQDLAAHYRDEQPGNSTVVGPPHVFHFAGHGLPQSAGLVLRDRESGGPLEVSAEKIAALLRGGHQTRLVFLNACNPTAPGHGDLQPFGGLAELLIQQGVPNVVGLQTPVRDVEARAVAEAFYSCIARGWAVDRALQRARRELFLLGDGNVAWAFLSLHVSGVPHPLCGEQPRGPTLETDEVLRAFGHEHQRQRLSKFLKRRSPTVVIVHGEQGSGHRHVLERLQVDLERAGNVLWRPVAVLRLRTGGEPLLQRAQLASGIARALGLADDGELSALEERIALALADRATEKVVVIDLVEVLLLHQEAEAEALLALVTQLWAELIERAYQENDTLSVFLLLSVGYPRVLPTDHPKAERTHEIASRTKTTMQRLSEISKVGRSRVEVLAKLEPFDALGVAEHLEISLDLDLDQAESIATNLVGGHDNETILQNLRHYLLDLEAP